MPIQNRRLIGLGANGGTHSGGGEEEAASDPIDVLLSYNPILLLDHLYSGTVEGVSNTPPADGEDVASWSDNSNNSHNGTSDAQINKPIYRTSGTLGIDMDTTGSFDTTLFTFSGAFTIYGIVARATGASACLVADVNSGATSEIGFAFPSSVNRFRLVADDGTTYQTNAITVNGTELFRLRNPANGVTQATFASTGQASANLASIPANKTYAVDTYGPGPGIAFTSTSRIRHLIIIPSLIAAGGADDIAIKAAINSLQGTSLTISGE